MKRVLVVFVSLILVLSISVVGAASAQDERATGSQVIFLGVSGTSDCSHLVPQVYVRTTESMYLAATAIYEDQIVGDAFVPANYPGGVIGTATLNYVNNRGRAPIDVWPLTPGKKVEYFLTLFTLDLQPVYEARAVFASCDATTFTSTTHGPAYNLLENHSFEAPGESGGVFDADLAAFWKGKNTFNDSRVCAAPRGGSSNYEGDCGFLFIAEPSAKSKLKQTYTGAIGQKKDIVYLHGFAQSFTGYTGGAKVKAILTFADGTSNTLAVTLPAGEHLYGTYPYATPFEAFMKLKKPLVSAKLIIQQKFGTGNIAFDSVTLSVMTNSNTPLRALPVPAAGAAPVDLLGG
ncbi:MAG: hypothetical protein HND48_00475 [Chloroflexi bacterium]|nr:hypothetical protein [Chloroflexota bacterium]